MSAKGGAAARELGDVKGGGEAEKAGPSSWVEGAGCLSGAVAAEEAAAAMGGRRVWGAEVAGTAE